MEIARHWRLKAQRYRLEGSTCPSCGQRIFSPRPVCTNCTAQAARIDVWELPVLQASMGSTEIESHIRYRITERMIR